MAENPDILNSFTAHFHATGTAATGLEALI